MNITLARTSPPLILTQLSGDGLRLKARIWSENFRQGNLPVDRCGRQRRMDIHEILKILPHRFPMLLVDRIIWVSEDGKACKGLKNVTINEPYFQGHYPGVPIMPGVFIIETIAQTGAAILLSLPEFRGFVPLIGAIDSVKFKRKVEPGDQLICECTILWVRGTIGRMKGVATVDGEVAASLEMSFKLSARDQ